ncbi:2-amino-4-hydroxy-6-hydroxymethyldihydropteridine diphosphokinase [Microbacterium sp. NPDC091313]
MSAPVAVVAAGSNLGDRRATIDAAFAEIAELPLVDEVRVSDTLETVAMRPDGEDADAPRYLNAVALVRTRLAPSVLLLELHRIELRHGRERRERWGDRTLDLDLVTWGDVRSDDARLLLPHPRAAEREFVLAPWARLDGDAHLPGSGRVIDLLDRLGGRP